MMTAMIDGKPKMKLPTIVAAPVIPINTDSACKP